MHVLRPAVPLDFTLVGPVRRILDERRRAFRTWRVGLPGEYRLLGTIRFRPQRVAFIANDRDLVTSAADTDSQRAFAANGADSDVVDSLAHGLTGNAVMTLTPSSTSRKFVAGG